MNQAGVRAGLVGIGVALVVVIAFELIFAVQALVFLLALPVGLLIGWYAIERERIVAVAADTEARPLGWPRATWDGVVAGVMTGVTLALVYVVIRLVFLYLDTGFRTSGPPYTCSTGPDCSYQRAVDEPSLRAALQHAGVHDAAGYTAYFLEGQALGGGALVLLVLAGSVAGAVGHRLTAGGTAPATIPAEGPR